jgi:hypothetical protein
MAHPDPGPLLDEHLDEFELICRASENDGHFEKLPPGHETTAAEDFFALDYVLGWHDRHDRKLLEAARWAMANGWAR